MTGIIFHTGIFNPQEIVSYIPDVYALADILFSHFDEQENTFFHRSISIHELRTEEFRLFVDQKSCIELK